MELLSINTSTAANAVIIGSIFYAIRSSVRTRKLIENGRTNVGLAMILVGLVIISLHYLANVVALHFLPHFMSISDTWTIMRGLRLNGYWIIMGVGLLCLVSGLIFVFRDLRTLAPLLHQTEEKARR